VLSLVALVVRDGSPKELSTLLTERTRSKLWTGRASAGLGGIAGVLEPLAAGPPKSVSKPKNRLTPKLDAAEWKAAAEISRALAGSVEGFSVTKYVNAKPSRQEALRNQAAAGRSDSELMEYAAGALRNIAAGNERMQASLRRAGFLDKCRTPTSGPHMNGLIRVLRLRLSPREEGFTMAAGSFTWV